MTRPVRAAAALAAAALLAATLDGCITSMQPPAPRRFRPTRPAAGGGVASVVSAPALRVREVTAASHLQVAVAWATPDDEVGLYDDRLWTEPPRAYVEEALARALFDAGRARRSLAATAPSLTVRVLAFEERVGGAAHEAVVALRLVLADEGGRVLLEREVAARAPLADDDPLALAKGAGQALEAAAREAAEAVAAALAGR